MLELVLQSLLSFEIFKWVDYFFFLKCFFSGSFLKKNKIFILKLDIDVFFENLGPTFELKKVHLTLCFLNNFSIFFFDPYNHGG